VEIEFLYNSAGQWIAFRQGKFVWDKEVELVGWSPWGDGDVVTMDGDYLGTIFPGNRLYRKTDWVFRGYPEYPGHPEYPGYPGYPGYAGASPLPLAAEDIASLRGA
jgi:hypothetical protein